MQCRSAAEVEVEISGCGVARLTSHTLVRDGVCRPQSLHQGVPEHPRPRGRVTGAMRPTVLLRVSSNLLYCCESLTRTDREVVSHSNPVLDR